MMGTVCCVHKKGEDSDDKDDDQRMPEFPSEGASVDAAAAPSATNGEMASSIMENLQNKKSSLLMNRQQAAFSTTATSAATSNETHKSSSSSSSSTSSSSAQMVTKSQSHSASTTSSASRLSRSQQMTTHSVSASEMNMKKANSEKFARSMSLGATGLKLAGGPQRVFSVDRVPINEEPIPIVEEMSSDLVPVLPGAGVAAGTVATASVTTSATSTSSSHSSSEMKFQQQQTSTSKRKVVTDGFSAEKVEASKQDVKRIQTGDMSFEEKHSASAVKEKLETESFSAEKSAAVVEEQYQMKSGDVTQQEQKRAAAATMKVSTENFTAQKTAMAQQAERQTVSSHGVTHQETHMAASSSSRLTFTSAKGVSSSTSQSASILSSQLDGMGMSMGMLGGPPEWPMVMFGIDLTDLDSITAGSGTVEVQKAVTKYRAIMSKFIDKLRSPTILEHEATGALQVMDSMMRKAWAIPSHGSTMGYSLCDVLRDDGGLDILINNCSSQSSNIQFCSARVLEQCLITQNRAYVVENGLSQVVMAAKNCSEHKSSYEYTRVGTGILSHLFKHSEGTCSSVIKMGGLDAVLEDCRETDVETLRHCASALANLSLYGGSENHQSMIKRKVPVWLFPLVFNQDDNIKYYACLALAALVANKEIEAAVLSSGTLNLVEPFIDAHNPAEFATSSVAHVHGQSKDWLQRLVPVLNSKRKEARSLAAFHFAMEAGIKKLQGITDIFHDIGAIEPLKKAASSPNALASKYAAQALRLIGEEIPHKLIQQVPLWTVEDVVEWLKQIGFSSYTQEFKNSRVDGDLLLQLTERMLLDDIGIKNGILRKRFMRELGNLKKMTDYSSCDSTNLNTFLQSIAAELSQYTYPLLQSGVDKDVLRSLTDEQLSGDCGIDNSIHRLRILESIKGSSVPNNSEELTVNKDLDVFISYRRSNGSQLASLLKVHLQLRGFSVFIDVERLEAGKFDNNLLQSIRQAKHFILVLTPTALDRCIGDVDRKDWVHREIVAALQSQCNIIPITDNFQWPEPEQLPEDMRAVSYFNGVRWIHDYQDACVEKLERFMRGDIKGTDVVQGRYGNLVGGNGTPGTPNMANGRSAPYQRSHSNESKGSVGSDNGKESYANNNMNGPEITLIE